MSSSSSPTAPHSCANSDIVAHTFTYNNRFAVDDVFVVFDESSLREVSEEAVQFQNMTMTTTTSHMSSSARSERAGTSMLVPPQLSADQDQAMSLRILALLASTSLLAVHGAAEGQDRAWTQRDLQAGEGQDEVGLGREVRCVSHHRPRHTGSEVPGSTMSWQSSDRPTGTGISDGQQCPWVVGRMREMPPTTELHPSLRCSCPAPKGRSLAGGHQLLDFHQSLLAMVLIWISCV